MQLEIFNTRMIPKNRDELGRFCTKDEYRSRQGRYWRGKAEMYERAYFALCKRLTEIERKYEKDKH